MPYPQMGMPMGMPMGQLPDLPTVKELWKKEKTDFRHWIILLGIGMITVFVLLIISTIMNASNPGTWDYAKGKGTGMMGKIGDSLATTKNGDTIYATLDDVNSAFRMTYLIWPSIQISLIGIGVILYITTAIQSYQAKSFEKLTGWATMIMGLGAIFALFNLFQLIWRNDLSSSITATPGGVFKLVNDILFILVYFAAGSQVGRIRRIFITSARVEQIKKSPEYHQAMEQMQAMMNGQQPPMGPMGPMGMGPFGATMGGATAQGTPQQNNQQPQQNNQSPQQQPTQAQQPLQPQKSDERNSLESMKVDDLRKVAKKLSISGIEKMKKVELVEAILRVSEKE